MDSSKPITLYSYRRCPFAIRVRLVLFEKKIPFLLKEEKLRDFSDELKALHPEVRVPLLVHGDRVIFESSIITEYLEALFPSPALLPSDPWLQTQMRLWTQWCNALFKPAIDNFKYKAQDQDFRQKGIKVLEGQLATLEKSLSTAPFLLGKNPSLADIHVFPFVRQLSRCRPAYPGWDKVPHIKKWFDHIETWPSYQECMKKRERVEQIVPEA